MDLILGHPFILRQHIMKPYLAWTVLCAITQSPRCHALPINLLQTWLTNIQGPKRPPRAPVFLPRYLFLL